MYMQACKHVYAYTHVYIYTCTLTYTYIINIHTYKYTYIHTYQVRSIDDPWYANTPSPAGLSYDSSLVLPAAFLPQDVTMASLQKTKPTQKRYSDGQTDLIPPRSSSREDLLAPNVGAHRGYRDSRSGSEGVVAGTPKDGRGARGPRGGDENKLWRPFQTPVSLCLSVCLSVCLSSVFFGVYECLCMFGAVERFCVRLDF